MCNSLCLEKLFRHLEEHDSFKEARTPRLEDRNRCGRSRGQEPRFRSASVTLADFSRLRPHLGFGRAQASSASLPRVRSPICRRFELDQVAFRWSEIEVETSGGTRCTEYRSRSPSANQQSAQELIGSRNPFTGPELLAPAEIRSVIELDHVLVLA
jgi:hypothetical protein